MQEISLAAFNRTNAGVPDRLARAVTACLLAASLCYAARATTWLPHQLPPAKIVDVFIAGALPGLLVTLLLWMARPGLFDRRLCRRLIGVSLSGAAVVALVPPMIAGF